MLQRFTLCGSLTNESHRSCCSGFSKRSNCGRVMHGLWRRDRSIGVTHVRICNKSPFRTNSGLTPKNAGLNKTKSAIFPVLIDPILSDIPCTIAGLIVYLPSSGNSTEIIGFVMCGRFNFPN